MADNGSEPEHKTGPEEWAGRELEEAVSWVSTELAVGSPASPGCWTRPRLSARMETGEMTASSMCS